MRFVKGLRLNSSGGTDEYYFAEPVPEVTVTPGVYHNPSLGLISLSSDGENRITMADKNLGATAVYNDGDAMSETNCGKYYQRGNNYGFPFTGTTNISNVKVSATGYGPGNYFSNSTFIYENHVWFSNTRTDIKNLWGDETGTMEARKGPCDTGYHIPSKSEMENFHTTFQALGIDNTGNALKIYFKMPISGYIESYDTSSAGTITNRDTQAYYQTTQASDSHFCWQLAIAPTAARITDYSYNRGFFIRPFKNEVIIPDGTWTVLYQPSV